MTGWHPHLYSAFHPEGSPSTLLANTPTPGWAAAGTGNPAWQDVGGSPTCAHAAGEFPSTAPFQHLGPHSLSLCWRRCKDLLNQEEDQSKAEMRAISAHTIPPGSRQGVMSIKLTFQNNLCLFCSWWWQWGPCSGGAPWEGARGDSWLVPGMGTDGTYSWALLVRNLGKSPLRKCIFPRFLSGRDPSGVLAAQAAFPSALFSPLVCPPAQLTWGMTWGTGLRHDDCALVWAAAL